MRKLLLTLAVLCGTVSGWAQESSSDPVVADGVYFIQADENGKRGYLAAGDYDRPVLTEISWDRYTVNSATAVENGKYWYIRTINGISYLYNIAKGQFVIDNTADEIYFGETPFGLNITNYNNYIHIGSGTGKRYLSMGCGTTAPDQVKWEKNNENDGGCLLTLTRQNAKETDFAEEIKVADKLILKSLGYLDGRYAIKNANNKYMKSNTHGSDFSGSLFELHPDLTKDKAHKIYSVTEGKWVSYEQKDSYVPANDRVVLVENEADAKAWYIKGMTGNYSDWYEVSPYTTTNEVAAIYLNWYQGTLDRNVGFWTGNGTNDNGSRWSFIELLTPVAGTEYVLYDETHKTFLDIHNLGTEPYDKVNYTELATMSSEKKTLYITTTANEGWKIHTTSDGGNYLGQYNSGKPWSSKVNADQSEYVWTVECTSANNEGYYVLNNLNGIRDGYLGTSSHADGKELYVDQSAGNNALKLKLCEAALVYKVVVTPAVGAVSYNGTMYANGEYILADEELEAEDVTPVNAIGYTHTLSIENNVINVTYNQVFVPTARKMVLKNKEQNMYMGVYFDGGELDNDPAPATHQLSGSSELDYRHCWELMATKHGSQTCYYLYNTYYGWYAGKITGRNTAINVVYNVEDAGKFEVDCVNETVNDEVVEVVTFRCLNRTATHEYWYLHQTGNNNNRVVDWENTAAASKWYITVVTDEKIADLNDQVKQDMALFKEYCDAMVRPGIGYYSGLTEEQIDAIKKVEVNDAAIDMEKAKEYVKLMHYGTSLVLNEPEAGFYRIKSMNASNSDKNGKYIQLKTDLSGMEEVAEATSKSIIYINKNKNLLHYTIGRYQNGYGAPATVGSTADTWQISENPQVKGAYSLKASSQSNYLSDWSNIGGGQNSTNEAWTFEPVESLPVTITSAGYATFYCPVAVTLPEGEGLTAYYVSATTESSAQMTEITGVIPANTGVILEGEPYTYDLTIGGEAKSVTNKLSGTVASEYISTPSYVLSAQGDPAVVGFYKAMLNFTVADGIGTKVTENGTHFLNNGFKAYLPAGGNNARALVFDFGTETAIESVESVENNAVVYDLSGRRVQNAQKGLYIVNGKKVIK